MNKESSHKVILLSSEEGVGRDFTIPTVRGHLSYGDQDHSVAFGSTSLSVVTLRLMKLRSGRKTSRKPRDSSRFQHPLASIVASKHHESEGLDPVVSNS